MSLSRTGENHAELNRRDDYTLLLLPKEERAARVSFAEGQTFVLHRDLR